MELFEVDITITLSVVSHRPSHHPLQKGLELSQAPASERPKFGQVRKAMCISVTNFTTSMQVALYMLHHLGIVITNIYIVDDDDDDS